MAAAMARVPASGEGHLATMEDGPSAFFQSSARRKQRLIWPAPMGAAEKARSEPAGASRAASSQALVKASG